jgi:hypothetical protein
MTTDTITVKTTEPNTFDRTVADLKQGVDYSTKASEKTIRAAKDFVAFNQASLEASTQASKIFATEARDLSRQAVACNQAAFDEILSGFRALVGAKSIKENIELQAASPALPPLGRFPRALVWLRPALHSSRRHQRR